MKKAWAKIEKAFEENPLAVVAVGSGAALATAKLIQAFAEAANARSWKKEVNRRDRKDRRR
jgi:alcohol dehydrogenase class IV